MPSLHFIQACFDRAYFAVFTLGMLVGVCIAVLASFDALLVVFRLRKRDGLNRIARTFARYTWPLRMGDRGDVRPSKQHLAS